MKKMLFVICVGLCSMLSFSNLAAQSEEEAAPFNGIELPDEELNDDVVDLFHHESITKEIDGVVDKVGEGFIIVRSSEDEQLKLLIDAETVIYVDEKKGDITDIADGDNVFAFYIDEGGFLKCDLLDVVKG